MPDSSPPPGQPKPEAATLGSLDAGELLARALEGNDQSVRSNWIPLEPEELATLLPNYRIEKLIGRGGMGAVYRGRQPELERPVAIKVLPAEIATNPEFVTRFKREAQTLAKLQHSRIITIHDFGQTSAGHLYFVMEYIDGTDLRSILKGPGLTVEQTLLVISQICDALHAAHQHGVIHRDIKPENVLITRDGYVKLADFGLARPITQSDSTITGTDRVLGTPAYMAPEQRSGIADPRSDVFALGVMLYEMLTGRIPYGAFDPPSQDGKLDARLDGVVLKALQQEPERRYQQASEMKTDVDRIRTEPQIRQPVNPRSKAGNKAVWLVVGIGSLVALAFLFAAVKSRPAKTKDHLTANTLTPTEVAEGWKLLFNGKDLSGWKGSPGLYFVEDGAITVAATEEKPAREDKPLIWDAREIADFELKYQVKIQLTGKPEWEWDHAFFFVRSKARRADTTDMSGYEQLLGRGAHPGHVRDSARGYFTYFDEWGSKVTLLDGSQPPKPAIRITGQLAECHLVEQQFQPDGWNDYGITANGNHLQFYAKGRLIFDVLDETTSLQRSGYLGLKLFQRSRSIAQFRSIKLKEIHPSVLSPKRSTPLPSTPIPTDPLIGRWRFFNGSDRVFSPDGTSKDQNGQPAVWSRENPGVSPPRYKIIYEGGRFTDRLTMKDNDHLDGIGLGGIHVTARRTSVGER